MLYVCIVPRGEQSQCAVVDGMQVWKNIFETAFRSSSGGGELLLQAMQHIALVVIELGHEKEDDAPFQGRPNLTPIHTTVQYNTSNPSVNIQQKYFQ